MVRAISKKRIRRALAPKVSMPTSIGIPIDEDRIKQLIKQAVREVLQEERENTTPQILPSQNKQRRERENPLGGKGREEITELALQAEGSWKESEGAGTSVEIVRRLRDEWKLRP